MTRSLGVDIGKRRDHAAAVRLDEDKNDWTFSLARRLPLGTGYPALTRAIAKLSLSADVTAVDGNGVGDVVIDYLREDNPGLNLWRVITHNGKQTTVDYNLKKYNTPKKSLIGVLAHLVHKKKVKFVKGEKEGLIEEMMKMEARQLPSGFITLQASTGHDDIVCAACLAIIARMLSGTKVVG